jgi:hypothetical protein
VSVSVAIPATVQIKRHRLFGLMAAVAGVAAAITWAVLVYAFDTGRPTAASTPAGAAASAPSAAQDARRGRLAKQADGYGRGLSEIGTIATGNVSSYASRIANLSRLEQASAFGGPGAELDALGLTKQDLRYVKGIVSMTTTQQAAAFGR